MIKKLQTHHLLAGAIAGLLLVLAALIVVNVREAPREEVESPAVSDADLVLQKFEYTETREGRRQWTIVADSAGYRQAAGETLIENLEVRVFAESEQGEDVILTALHGRVDVNARNVEVWDNVVVTAGTDYRLLTDRLFYDVEQGAITTSAPVHILSRSFDVRGRGLRMEVATRKLEVLSEVQASLVMDRSGMPNS